MARPQNPESNRMGVKYHAKLLIAIALLWAVTVYFWPNPGFLLLMVVPFCIPIYIGHRAARLTVIPSFPSNLKFVAISFLYNCLFTLMPVLVGHLTNDHQRYPQSDYVWQSTAILGGLSFTTAFAALVPPSIEKRNRAYPSRES